MRDAAVSRADAASRAPRARGRPKCGSTSTDVAACGGCDPTLVSCVAGGRRAFGLRTLFALAALRPRPRVGRDYPASLSISISGGKETYEDSPSNGERSGNSPALESGGVVVGCSTEKRPRRRTGPKSPGRGRGEGEPRCAGPVAPRRASTSRVVWECGPNRAAKYGRETDSEQVPRGKDEKDFEKKRVKECLKLSGGKRMGRRRCARSDAERRRAGPPIDSGRGPAWIGGAAKAGLSIRRGTPSPRLWRRGARACGVLRHLRARTAAVGSPFDRLETRTKESTCVRVNGRVNP
ncbi:hypothetical protein RND71_034624 [Anisodus tanguticus]|uniref:Uncharacterized protein n=1 Tax=Anisodus tanguticus TaxID=243964 RepID=A0AAE1RAY2_9SOLA|nr:hypothetical protein RND71_034624 [Anisodus tanguticus]